MSYIVENSAQLLWLVWIFLWQSIWVLALGVLLQSIINILKEEEGLGQISSFHHSLQPFLKRAYSKTPFGLPAALLAWHFIGFKGLFFLICGALVAIVIFVLLSYFKAATPQRIKDVFLSLQKIDYLKILPVVKKYFTFIAKEVSQVEFWKQVLRNFEPNLVKLIKPYIIGILIAAIIGAYIPFSFWLHFIHFPSLWSTFPQNFLVGFILGLLTPFILVLKLPLGIQLWHIGLPTSSLFAFLFTPLFLPKLSKQDLRQFRFKNLFSNLLKLSIATACGSSLVHLLTKASRWSFLHQAPELKAEIGFNTTFWLNSAAILLIIGALIIAANERRNLP